MDENRTIVTMDRDFLRMTRFPPDECAGIVVVMIYRLTVEETTRLFAGHFDGLSEDQINRNLVIIHPDRVRVRRTR